MAIDTAVIGQKFPFFLIKEVGNERGTPVRTFLSLLTKPGTCLVRPLA